MSGYTVIADVSNTLIKLLRSTLTPEPIKNPETIGLCQPNEMGGLVLGLTLYDIVENPEMYSQNKIQIDSEHYKDPPMSYFLHYMLFARSQSELSARHTDEQRILGRALQQMNNFRRIPSCFFSGMLEEENVVLDVQGISLTVDEKTKIWTLFTQPYHISFYYKVGPIFLDTDLIKSVKRITNAKFVIKQ